MDEVLYLGEAPGNTGIFVKVWFLYNICLVTTVKFLEIYIKLPNLKMYLEKSSPKIIHPMLSNY